MYGKSQEHIIDAETLRKILLNGKDDDEFMMGDIGTITMMQNHIFFYADIVPSSVLKLNNVIMQMMREQLGEAASRNKEIEPIHVHLNSPGGLASAGFIGYDVISAISEKIPVWTHIEGHVASAATLLSIAGTKRIITPSSDMLIHEISSWIGGKASEISQQYSDLIKVQNRLENIYLKHSKLKKEELQDLLKKDRLLTAEEALEKGLVDSIETIIF